MKRLLCVSLAWLMGVSSFSGMTIIGAGVFGAAMISSAPDAEAQRRGRSTSRTRTTTRGRGVSRSTTVRHTTTRRPVAAPVVRGTARRTTRRVVRRHMYALPRGYRTITRGSYRYYYYSGLYYYPYYMSGRTVYVEITIDSNGNPTAPPPASEININVSTN